MCGIMESTRISQWPVTVSLVLGKSLIGFKNNDKPSASLPLGPLQRVAVKMN